MGVDVGVVQAYSIENYFATLKNLMDKNDK
jgi:hypothetical protein